VASNQGKSAISQGIIFSGKYQGIRLKNTGILSGKFKCNKQIKTRKNKGI